MHPTPATWTTGRLSPQHPTFSLVALGPDCPGRDAAECYLASAYAARFGARLEQFMPTLLVLEDPAGRLAGVVGCRQAALEHLYLEQYLDLPVERSIARHQNLPARREEITELGNFAAADCRAARRLVSLLPGYLLAQGQVWAVFTATDLVRQILASVGTGLIELAGARENRLLPGAGQWGSYFRQDPRVMATRVPDALGISTRHRRRKH